MDVEKTLRVLAVTRQALVDRRTSYICLALDFAIGSLVVTDPFVDYSEEKQRLWDIIHDDMENPFDTYAEWLIKYHPECCPKRERGEILMMYEARINLDPRARDARIRWLNDIQRRLTC